MALLGVVLAGAACDLVGPGDGDAAGDLERARQRWAGAAIDDYALTMERWCYCGLLGPVRVEVRDGLVVDREVLEPGAPAGALLDALYPDVEGLFEVVEDAVRRHAHRLTVVYHPTLGYPSDIDIDYAENVQDEELAIEASLVPLGGAP
jgi:hypothetical protein